MKTIMIFILLIILVIVGLWVYGFNAANDLSVPTKDISKLQRIKRVLIIFPHPDDEANSLSGTITQFVDKGIETDWIILTKGEKGNEGARYDENLKEIRSKEAQNVARLLKISSPILKDYPDGEVDVFKNKLKDDIRQIIKDKNPDLIITYDESGGYGHPDHVIISKVVTELVNTEFSGIHLWYTSVPKKLFVKLSLPEEMARDKGFVSDRKFPTFKIWSGISGLANKIKVVYTYNSQFQSFVKSVPVKQIPMWFYISLTPYEYFYEVK